MKKERMKILDMVDEGKISVDEATKLLEAMSSTNESVFYNSDDFEERMSQFSKNVESFCDDISNRFSDKYKNVEPRLKQAAKVVVEKTANIADEVAKSLHESLKNLDENLNDVINQESSDDTPKEN